LKPHNLNALHFFLALGLAVLLLLPFEWYWSEIEEYTKSYDLKSLDNWADQRKKVAQLSEDDVVLLGSSRLHFDTNIDLWDSLTGRQPLQLAYPGSSPFVTLEDIVKKPDFKGLIVVGVSPGLFFTVRSGWGVRRSQAFIDHYYERTFAQVLNQYLYNFVDTHFAYLREDLTLTQLIERW